MRESEWSERVHDALNAARRVYVKSARNSAMRHAQLIGKPPPELPDGTAPGESHIHSHSHPNLFLERLSNPNLE